MKKVFSIFFIFFNLNTFYVFHHFSTIIHFSLHTSNLPIQFFRFYTKKKLYKNWLRLILVFHSNLWWTRKQNFFFQRNWQWTTTKRENTLCMPVSLCSTINSFIVAFVYTNSPILSFAPFVDFHCCVLPFFAMMNFVHFLWIVSHIFISSVSPLIVLKQPCMCLDVGL